MFDPAIQKKHQQILGETYKIDLFNFISALDDLCKLSDMHHAGQGYENAKDLPTLDRENIKFVTVPIAA